MKASDDDNLSDISDSQDNAENHDEHEADDDFATTHTPDAVQKDYTEEDIFGFNLLQEPGTSEIADDDVNLGPPSPSRAPNALSSPLHGSQDESQLGDT
jgi:hypothetical protein